MGIKVINKASKGLGPQLQKLVSVCEKCVASAKGASYQQRKKWFGNGFDNAKVQACLDHLYQWTTDPACSIYFKASTEDDIASAKIKTAQTKQLGGQMPIGKGITIALGKHWRSGGAVDGDRLLAVIHEVTHKVIHTLDIVDKQVVSNYPPTVRAQIPSALLNSAREYYGFKRVLELRDKSSQGATLNADNWAYFIAEQRSSDSNIRFLSKQQETDRGEHWDTYSPDTGAPISTGEFV